MSSTRVLGVLAGGDFDPEMLRRWATSADIVLAADGGADSLLALGIVPHATIGDLDSITGAARSAQPDLVLDHDQDTSDCDKLLHLAVQRGYGAMTLIGIEGDRLDHVLSTLFSALRSPLDVRFALRQGLAHLIRSPFQGEFEVSLGERVSLVPLLPCENVSIFGVQWPLKNGDLNPAGLVSLSNRASEPRITVEISSGAAVLFTEGDEEPNWM